MLFIYRHTDPPEIEVERPFVHTGMYSTPFGMIFLRNSNSAMSNLTCMLHTMYLLTNSVQLNNTINITEKCILNFDLENMIMQRELIREN